MHNAGLYALTGIVGFALIFALLPAPGPDAAQSGARLEDAQLRLYPARDPDAVWQFRAAHVSSDPVEGLTVLTGLSGGQRTLQERGPDQQLTGRTVLDLTLSAPDLTIDAQDNLTTRQARLRAVQQCADITLSGSPQVPVMIEQGQGFRAPLAVLSAPYMRGRYEKLRMSFGLEVEDSDTAHSHTELIDRPAQRCENGALVPNT